MDNNEVINLDDADLEKVSGGYFTATEHTVTVTRANYNAVISSAPSVLIMFGAHWAGPSVQLRRTLETVASENDNAVIGIVDVDNDEDFCYELNVRAIPTTIRFVNGMEVERIVANQPLDFWMKII